MYGTTALQREWLWASIIQRFKEVWFQNLSCLIYTGETNDKHFLLKNTLSQRNNGKIHYTVTGNVLLANMERLSLHTLCLLFTYRLWNLLFLKNTIHFTHHQLMSHLITLNNKHDWWEPSYINHRLEIYSLLNLWNIMSGKCSHSSFELEW